MAEPEARRLLCNRARNRAAAEPHTLFGAAWTSPRPMANRFDPVELFPRSRAWVIREDDRGRGADVIVWDVAGGQARWPMTNVRNLDLPQWRRLAASPANRCLIPVTEFAEWTPKAHDVGGGRPIKGEMWFAAVDQPVFAIAGLWQAAGGTRSFAMVTCEPNALVAPVHPKAMVTILAPEDYDQWLRGDHRDLLALQRPYPAERAGTGVPDADGKLLISRQQRWMHAFAVERILGAAAAARLGRRISVPDAAGDRVGSALWQDLRQRPRQLRDRPA